MTAGPLSWLWLTGPSGVGKTTVGWELFTRLTRGGRRVGFVELDQLGMCLPAPPGEPGNDTLKATNLHAVLRAHQVAGADAMVVSGDITPTAMRQMLHASGLPSPLLCHLHADPASLRTRLHDRCDPAALADTTPTPNSGAAAHRRLLVDTTGLTVGEVADEIQRRLGHWPAPAREHSPDSHSRAVPIRAEPVITPPAGALLVCGPTAVGKSAVAWEVFLRSLAAGIPTTYLDLAQLSFLRPTGDGDRHHHHLAASVVAALWPTFAKAGARRLILAGHITRPSDVALYRRAMVGAPLTVCLLTAGLDTLTTRALQRGHGHATSLPGDELLGLPETRLRQIAAAAIEHARDVRRSGVADLIVETDDRPVRDIAQAILQRAALRDRTDTSDAP